jgi:putative transposase
MEIAVEAQASLPTRPVCQALGLSRATFYRTLAKGREVSPLNSPLPAERPPHPRALSPEERQAALDLLHAERFVDQAPAAIYATLLDNEERYLCSIRTMYRILKAENETRERRLQTSHPKRAKPRVIAAAPNEAWSWDITHLRTIVKGSMLKLYVVLDLYSRYVVGWYLSESESADEARHLIETLAARYGIDPGQLVIHADNGGPMRGRPLADLLESLGIERSHSRPRTSNDNPYSESQFKTMKYRPTYPSCFQSIEEARAWCREFFAWYNNEHRHESLGLLTPADVFLGRTDEVLEKRAQVLREAHAAHPERFVKGVPKPKRPAPVVAINPPSETPDPNAPDEAVQAEEVTKLATSGVSNH